ncbi:Cytochrome c oxidase assembly protein cox19 [Exophiala bonariae]|uniref:Cytochrome c oxidase assembly protein cox19 n=1 Tax=Exophiala bonariae TaxID=1690606 RepID=A0AAV9NBH6_9EURO|nr:Cytochrome c oxidase assembly protein cox19 [Exophiala bonariae]
MVSIQAEAQSRSKSDLADPRPSTAGMSGFGAPGGRAANIKPSPPERGSFPLDHDAECKYIISSYLRCLRRQNPPGRNTDECRLFAKEYLNCRMEKGLMAKDEWGNLGLEGLHQDQAAGEVDKKKS